MKTTTQKKTQQPMKQRNTYTADIKEKARKYYLMGLNMQEVSKLTDGIPPRTLEKWQAAGKWCDLKGLENIKVRAYDLHCAGKSYAEISELLKINRVTIWRYIKETEAGKA